MAEVLSQAQIDALLQGFNAGEVEADAIKQNGERKAKIYDFKSPKKFTKEQLKVIDSLHENMARLFSSYLSGLLRVFCEVSVLQIEEQRYYEYSNALLDGTLTALVDLKPVDKNIDNSIVMFNMPQSIGFFMIDRLLGGSGKGYHLTRGYTEIEIALLSNMFEKLTVQVQEAWKSYIGIEATFQSIETNNHFLQLNSPEDIVVIVALSVKINKIEGVISICISASNLAEMMTGFSNRYERTAKKQDQGKEETRKQVIFDSLTDSEIEIRAVFDHFQLDLQDVLHLQVDDVIPLSQAVNSEIQLVIDNTSWFKGKLGQTKLKKAVKISKLV